MICQPLLIHAEALLDVGFHNHCVCKHLRCVAASIELGIVESSSKPNSIDDVTYEGGKKIHRQMAASMEPRFFQRGRALVLIADRPNEIASMEPRFFVSGLSLEVGKENEEVRDLMIDISQRMESGMSNEEIQESLGIAGELTDVLDLLRSRFG